MSIICKIVPKEAFEAIFALEKRIPLPLPKAWEDAQTQRQQEFLDRNYGSDEPQQGL